MIFTTFHSQKISRWIFTVTSSKNNIDLFVLLQNSIAKFVPDYQKLFFRHKATMIMKKLFIFFTTLLCLFTIYTGVSFADVYPPGSDVPVKEIFTDSSPDISQRVSNASGT